MSAANAGRRDPNYAVGIGVTQLAEQGHVAPVVFPARLDIATVMVPFVLLFRRATHPGGHFVAGTADQKEP